MLGDAAKNRNERAEAQRIVVRDGHALVSRMMGLPASLPTVGTAR
jgi:hypothetical protein